MKPIAPHENETRVEHNKRADEKHQPHSLGSRLLLALSVSGVSAQSSKPVPRVDTQEWNDVQLAVTLNKKVDFVFSGVVRLARLNLLEPIR